VRLPRPYRARVPQDVLIEVVVNGATLGSGPELEVPLLSPHGRLRPQSHARAQFNACRRELKELQNRAELQLVSHFVNAVAYFLWTCNMPSAQLRSWLARSARARGCPLGIDVSHPCTCAEP
jgi:hypothetical protein